MSRRRTMPTTQEHAVEWLRQAVVTRALRPGQRVNQEDVADQIGVSIAPVREALRVLEQEGQLTYRPRRGYFVTELRFADLEEIYGLRRLLEEEAARYALPLVDEDMLDRMDVAARDCERAAEAGDVLADLEANRRFHFSVLDAPGRPYTLKLIQNLWDLTESYRALYYNSAEERLASVDAHARIAAAVRAGDADALVDELNDHRDRALVVLRGVLDEEESRPDA